MAFRNQGGKMLRLLTQLRCPLCPSSSQGQRTALCVRHHAAATCSGAGAASCSFWTSLGSRRRTTSRGPADLVGARRSCPTGCRRVRAALAFDGLPTNRPSEGPARLGEGRRPRDSEGNRRPRYSTNPQHLRPIFSSPSAEVNESKLFHRSRFIRENQSPWISRTNLS